MLWPHPPASATPHPPLHVQVPALPRRLGVLPVFLRHSPRLCPVLLAAAYFEHTNCPAGLFKSDKLGLPGGAYDLVEKIRDRKPDFGPRSPST